MTRSTEHDREALVKLEDVLRVIGHDEKHAELAKERWEKGFAAAVRSIDALVRGLPTHAALTAQGGEQTADTQHDRDKDWILAMGHALGLNSGFNVPIAPEAEPFRKLFAEIRERQTADTVGYVKLKTEWWEKLKDVFSRRFPRCRDCADEAGVCPHSGLPCEFDSMLLPTAAAAKEGK